MNYKQKIPLFCFVTLTIIASLALAALDIQKYISYLDANEAIKVYQEEINSNSSKNPSYNDKNKTALDQYSQKLDGIISQFKLQHGRPHRKALIEFASAVGLKEEQLMKKFADYYNALPDEKKGIFTDKKDKAIWDGFMKLLYCPAVSDKQFDPETMKYLGADEKVSEEDAKAYKEDANKQAKYKADKEKVEKAVAKFEEYSKKYLEYQIPSTQYKCILDALGLPVTGELSDLNDMLINQKYWANLIPGYKQSIATTDKKTNADVEKNLKRLIVSMDLGPWREDQLSLIYLQMQIKQDLYSRMKKADVFRVDSVLLEGNAVSEDSFFGGMGGNNKAPAADPLKGNPVLGNSFVVYTYRIKMSATIENIRKFLDGLNDAYKDYRTYNVRDLILTRELASEKFPEVLVQKDTSSRKEGQEVPDSYGAVVVGKDLNINCEMLVDYVIFVQDQLPRQHVK